jgi:hypothetical protein
MSYNIDKTQMENNLAYRRVGKAYLASRREKLFITRVIGRASLGDPTATYPGTGFRRQQYIKYYRPFINHLGMNATWPLKNTLERFSRGQIGDEEQEEIINGENEGVNRARKYLAGLIKFRRESKRRNIAPRDALGEIELYGMSESKIKKIKDENMQIYSDPQFSQILVEKFYKPVLSSTIGNLDPIQKIKFFRDLDDGGLH